MSFFRRLWQTIRRPKGYIGRDLEGNRYFELPNPNDAWGRPKRVVKYREGYDMWTYIAGQRRLPVQWTSWLTHTRVHPPTLEELTADLQRQERVKLKVALIAARDHEARARIAGATSTMPTNPAVSAPNSETPTEPVLAASKDDQRAENRVQGPGASPILPKGVPQPSPRELQPQRSPASPSTDEPQTWAPQAIRRGS